MSDDIRGGGAEKRLERRVAAALPVTLDEMAGIGGLTTDVSASGMFFETDAVLAPGTVIHLKVDIDTPAGRRVLDCHGSIVRVETRASRIGCAVKIIDSRLVKP